MLMFDPIATDPIATDPIATDPIATDPIATPFQFSTGDDSVLATNEVVEATGAVPPADTNRYFRVLEAD